MVTHASNDPLGALLGLLDLLGPLGLVSGRMAVSRVHLWLTALIEQGKAWLGLEGGGFTVGGLFDRLTG